MSVLIYLSVLKKLSLTSPLHVAVYCQLIFMLYVNVYVCVFVFVFEADILWMGLLYIIFTEGLVPEPDIAWTEKKIAGTLLSVMKKIHCSAEVLTVCPRL